MSNNLTEHSEKSSGIGGAGNVLSMFEAIKRRYERAVAAFESYRCRGRGFNDLIEEGQLLDAATECQAAMLATPASTLADVRFKVELSRDNLADATDENSSVELLDSACNAIQAGDTAGAIEAIEAAIAAVAPDSFWLLDGATAALDDLLREPRP